MTATSIRTTSSNLLFHPETVSSWEVGLKSSWLDSRITSSLAVFRADYEDVEIPGSVGFDSDNDGVVDSFAGITSNAADADITGVEFEGVAQLAEPLNATHALAIATSRHRPRCTAS